MVKDAPESDEEDELLDEVPQQIFTVDSFKNDPYLASAIEFMYSADDNDYDDDFGKMTREQQEEFLKKTWIEREKKFYGD